ncbi:MAG: hypothetical protein NTV52_35855 [Acidobacteria bacterium]|nr:hypothetical protein [Acidobacteriota bacterium]
MALATVVFLTMPEGMMAKRRVVVAQRTRVVLRPGHPIGRVTNRMVIVRPARRVVAIRGPVVFLPPVVWGARAGTLPGRDRLAWEDSETIRRNEDWVDFDLGVDGRGDSLYLRIDGRAKLDFAEVTFENGQVQVVDFHERAQKAGTFQLLDFADGRKVESVRMVAKAVTNEAKLTVYLKR